MKKTTATIPNNALKPFLTSCSRERGRYCSNGVHVELADGDLAIVATDGCQLLTATINDDANAAAEPFRVTIPADTIKAFKPGRAGAILVEVHTGEDGEPAWGKLSAGGTSIEFEALEQDARFPPWREFVPAPNKSMRPMPPAYPIDPDRLARACKSIDDLAKVMPGIDCPYPPIEIEAESPKAPLVCRMKASGGTITGVIMPKNPGDVRIKALTRAHAFNVNKATGAGGAESASDEFEAA